MELESREEEIRFLKIQLAEEKRSIDLLRKSMPSKKNQEKELVTLQIQVRTVLQIRYYALSMLAMHFYV